ncbi:PTS system, cellobiose-specific IIC component [Propionispira arboris]|uniref:Permease IIC component n=1 Tax=Propionispira arboris TaxID=84035 RepID=A0A1H6UWR8_9FIRM|nr:PTS transporter subunit EIIC [Propionispira arboris]SEI96708.1 PTS system, cellobiose-specific IIC component [Propionispira arboris]
MQKMMRKLEDSLNKYLLPLSDIVNRNQIITAIKEGMIATLPIILLSSTVFILIFFPYLNQFAPALDAFLKQVFRPLIPVTLGIIALFVILSTANSYSRLRKIDSLFGVFVAVASFMLITPFSVKTEVMVEGQKIQNAMVSGVIPTANLGATGIITALIITILSIKIYSYIYHKNMIIKMPESVPPVVSKPFESIIPIGLTLLIFLGARLLIEQTDFGTLQNMIYTLLTKPLLGLGGNIWVVLFLFVISQILWFFGIHGTSAVIVPIWKPVATVMMVENLDAFNAGLPLPYLMTYAFMALIAHCRLSPILALTFLGKSKQAKSIGKVSLIPALFNIHEPFIYGLPIVLNVPLMIPWIIVEPLQIGLAYGLAVWTDCIPVLQMPFTLPPILQGLLATNFNLWSIVITLAVFVFGFICWYPFIKILDKQMLLAEQSNSDREV